MQYILTEQEYQELKQAQKLSIDIQRNELQVLCTKIADEMPVKYWGSDEARPWGCIHSNPEWYCNNCPVETICPHEFKEWSK